MKDPFQTKPVPIESAHRDLSIGTGFIEIGAFYVELGTKIGRPMDSQNDVFGLHNKGFVFQFYIHIDTRSTLV